MTVIITILIALFHPGFQLDKNEFVPILVIKFFTSGIHKGCPAFPLGYANSQHRSVNNTAAGCGVVAKEKECEWEKI
jgi:hypothetical protein